VHLLPPFEAGLYDKFPFEKEGHHLYFHLRDGHYRLKRGMAKTWELVVFDGSAAAQAAAAKLVQQPLVLQSPNDWNCASGAFYAVHPRDEARFKAYEDSADRNVTNYLAARERQRDYGFINHGDWYGERGANWGNIEYDTQNAFFLEFIRSGNLDAFRLGCDAELHKPRCRYAPVVAESSRRRSGLRSSDGPRRRLLQRVGARHAGHPQGRLLRQPCLGRGPLQPLVPDRRPALVGHRQGNRRLLHRQGAVAAVRLGVGAAAGLASDQTPRPLSATNDPYYLNASRIIVDRVLETQDPAPRPLPKYQAEQDHREFQVGGWTRMMLPGHCLCEPRHRGGAGFMVSILLSGLTYYHDVTGEPAVKEAIIRGAHYLMDECYSTTTHGFRYTSCPNMRYTSGASPLMLEGIARAYRWTKDPRFIDPLTEALALDSEGAAYGKSFSQYYRAAPRLLSDLAATGLGLLEPKRAETAKFVAPEWLTKLPADRKLVLQAEDFTAQGGGAVEVVADRQESWGTMLTKWHADEGHWLAWAFDVPTAGHYDIRLRYASGGTKPVRKVELDGKVLAEALAFEPTGGFATATGQWAWRTLRILPARTWLSSLRRAACAPADESGGRDGARLHRARSAIGCGLPHPIHHLHPVRRCSPTATPPSTSTLPLALRPGATRPGYPPAPDTPAAPGTAGR